MAIHIGTSGWSYDHWQGVLYPDSTPVRERLSYYVERFGTVELNSSFYHWPREQTFASWRQRLPDGFQLTVKAPRGLTHSKRLYAPEVWADRIARCWHILREKRAVLLVQLSPNFAFDYARLDYFLGTLPEWIRVAVEFRHPSWHQEPIFELLEKHQAAYCVMSGAGLPCILRATASFVYVRLHGPDPGWLYGGSYSDDDLRWWAYRLREWEYSGKEVYVYFNNDGGGNAVRNALTLKHFLNR
ncbi:DUF72 domain-containing protein [Persicitalea jodogahamensis]|uniref:Sensor histidine kinase n=1 Tax=Persicitalea jodogahamensis TaxID=402147 RepID=A0A8J3D4J3_9BACT|nr:DUF72 domain-containing protein [Persicitalea jodogahamensis]GHB73877.1 hypothetical protein GCM10007390_30100 [Persicitalea jodogahamensis]